MPRGWQVSRPCAELDQGCLSRVQKSLLMFPLPLSLVLRPVLPDPKPWGFQADYWTSYFWDLTPLQSPHRLSFSDNPAFAIFLSSAFPMHWTCWLIISDLWKKEDEHCCQACVDLIPNCMTSGKSLIYLSDSFSLSNQWK